MKKKGLSTVVATVLMVILTIGAVAVLVQFLVPFIGNSLQKSTECIKVKEYFKFEKGEGSYNCLEGKNALVTISASNENESYSAVRNLKLSFYSDGSENFNIVGNSKVHLLDYGKPTVLLKSGETRTYNVSLNKVQGFVEIYPVLQNGRVCDSADKINLEACP